jgi:hypothetical protein
VTIGYSVEGSTDRALLNGLRTRWCPYAALIEGPFRGRTEFSRRRDYPKICEQFIAQSVDVMIFMKDADATDWRGVQRLERSACPEQFNYLCIHAVCERNVECWICADPDWLATKLGCDPEPFRSENPKRAFEHAIGVANFDKKESEIAALVGDAPLRSWLQNSRSFEDFYDQVRHNSQRLGCQIENLRERA